MSRGEFLNRKRGLLLGGVICMLLLLAVANGHLLFLAFASEPPCVEHRRLGEEGPSPFAAARSACRTSSLMPGSK